MQKYVILQFLEEVYEGDEFMATNWPQHVTIAANFVVDWKGERVFEKLSALLATRRPITTTAGDDEYFGPQQQVHVTVLEMNPELASLHNDIINLLRGVGATFDEPQYLEAGYRAHSTIQKHARLHKGDAVRIQALTVVDMFPHNDIRQRRVLQTIKLTGGN